MFNLSALVILTIFNLIALTQIAANILLPVKLKRGPVLAAATVCLATSLTGLAMAVLVPSPVVGIASVTLAALVNLLAVLGTGLDRLSDPTSTEAIRYLRGLARLAIIGVPHDPITPPLPPRSAPARKPAPARCAQTTTHITPDPLPKLLAAASQATHSAPKPKQPARTPALPPASAQPLTPRQRHSVPHRPNRLPTSSLAFLLSVDPHNLPDIFADARASMNQLSALARRVRLVATDPLRPPIPSQSTSVWPTTTFSQPDPAWRTSYGRIPAIAAGF